MKQHITYEQLNSLPATKGVRLIKVWRDNGQQVNLLNHTHVNVGTMIEFLLDKDFFDSTWDGKMIMPCGFDDASNMCDALWEAVKEVLEK